MSDANKKSDTTCHEGVTPVQFFRSPAIPVTPGMKLAPRLGRPKRELSPDEDNGLPNEKPTPPDKSP